MNQIHHYVQSISDSLDRWVERTCVALLGILVLTVWIGILSRYILPWNLTFTEELARYLMIWTALLAISIGICRRQHVGMLVIFERLPRVLSKALALFFDVIAFIFFAFMFYYGIGHVEQGFSQVTMIYGMPKGYPYLVIPVASALACIQLCLALLRDLLADKPKTAIEHT
ncbi:TRAP transporter small permease [Aidingimonas lacisalsi]|uniref:TRAP transporter small permease n=1 Tax=Aidingimonas lacisalsi TaxID=2604086 RepID=UPI0011D1DB7C|nr:TRAP transporter small permease [Aidingimonas lacisalsi]